MTMSFLAFWITVASALVCVSSKKEDYKTYYLEENCYPGKYVLYNLESSGLNSAAILQATRSSVYRPGLQCTAVLKPPPGHGIVVSIRQIDLGLNCVDYLKIQVGEKAVSVLCGGEQYRYEERVYTSPPNNDVVLNFHTTQAKRSGSHIGFQLTFTAYREGDDSCADGNSFQCYNAKCIWRGLTCDGHNNCGDNSDEADFPQLCRTGVLYLLIVYVLPTVLLLVFFISCYFIWKRFGPKSTRTVYVRLYPPHSSSSPCYGAADPVPLHTHAPT